TTTTTKQRGAGGRRTSIYAAIGGAPAIAAAVDGLYERILRDRSLKKLFQSVDLDRLKEQQRYFFGQALSGPEVYEGPDMRVAHAGMGITRKQFDRVADHLVATLTDLGVSKALVGEIVDVVAPLADQIVDSGAASQRREAAAPRRSLASLAK